MCPWEGWIQELRQAGPLKLAEGPPVLSSRDVVPIVALGHWGGRVLENLVSFWEERGLSSESLPFLWIEVALPGEDAERLRNAFDLPERYKVVLAPPWGELTAAFLQNPRYRPFFSWLIQNPDQEGPFPSLRLAGRAAFYWEIMRGPLSRLWGRLYHFIQEGRTRIRIVAAAWEQPVSGFLADLAAFYMHHHEKSTPIELWLLGPVEASFQRARLRFTPDQMRQTTIRVLWEASRFQRQRQVPFVFTFSPPQSVYRQDHQVPLHLPLFERIYFFQGKEGETHLIRGLRLLAGKPQQEYQKRLLNYQKDWPKPLEPTPVDGFVVSIGALLRTSAGQEAEQAFTLALLSGLLFGPLGLWPREDGPFLEMDFPYTPRIRKNQVKRLHQDLLELITSTPDPLDVDYHKIEQRLLEHLNAVGNSPNPQGHPPLEVQEVLRILQEPSSGLPELVRENLAALLQRFQQKAQEFQKTHRYLRERWKRAWKSLSTAQKEILRERYREFFAPLFRPPPTLSLTLWYRLRKRVAWLLLPIARMGRIHWRVGFALFPVQGYDNEPLDTFFHEDVSKVLAHWRHMLLLLPDLRVTPTSISAEDFYREVRAHFGQILPKLSVTISPHLEAPHFHHLALLVTPHKQEWQEIERFLKDEAPERFPEILTVAEPALDGYGLLLHKEPYPMHILSLLQETLAFHPQEFAYRGEQFQAWLQGFPKADVFLDPDFRTWLEYHETRLRMWSLAWVLLSSPPRFSFASIEVASDIDLYFELYELCREAYPFVPEAPPQTPPTPESPLKDPKDFPLFQSLWRWWEQERSASSAQETPNPKQGKLSETLEDLLQEWKEDYPEELQARARYVLESCFPEERRWQRRFNRLERSQQQALFWFYIVARMVEDGYLP